MTPNINKFRKASSHAKSLRGGISLKAFANAKKSTYDPRHVKDKEKIRAAKTVNQYKKFKQRLHQESGAAPSHHDQQQITSGDEEHENPRKSSFERNDKRRRFVETNNDNDNGNDAYNNNEQEEHAKKRAEEEEQRNAAIKKRKYEKKVFKKKTRHGQPLMKYRIEKMLHKLEDTS